MFTGKTRRRFWRLMPFLLAFGLVISTVVATQVAASVPASAGTDTYPTSIAGCRDIATGAIVTCDLKDSAQDSYIDPWGEYNRECTSYVAWMLHSVNGFEMPFHDNASGWVADARADGYTVNTKPAVGAVAWMSIGHVAWVEAVNSNGTVNTEDYNYSYNGTYEEHLSQPANTYQEYIHFKDVTGGGSGFGGNPPPTPGPAIAAAAHASGEQDVFWKGADSNLWETWYSAGRWNGPANIGMGPLGSAPTVAVRPSDNQEDVFWKGTDGHLYLGYWNDTSWNGAIDLGMGTLGSPPTATAWGDEVDVFWEGSDGNLWEAWQDGNGPWNGPVDIGMGPLGSAPTAAAHASGEQDVFWKGTDSNLWETWYSAGRWNGPANIGMGPLGSSPTAAVVPANNQEHVFWEGTDGNIWGPYYDTSWHGPGTLVVGPLGDAPAATAWGTNIDVFWRNTSGSLLEEWWNGSGWYGPASLNMGYIPAS